MKLKVNYFENIINLNDDHVQVIEIENKKTFYRFISNLYAMKNGDKLNEIYFYNKLNEEININEKIEVYTDFFNFDFNSKKNLSSLNKCIINYLSPDTKEAILNNFQKLYKIISKHLFDFDLPLEISDNVNLEDVLKLMKISINNKNDLLDNLLLLIDLENMLKVNNILFFVNLKQLLSKEEIIEFYKYAIYNNIKIVLIDSQSYGIKLEYENKLIIDENLDEFVL